VGGGGGGWGVCRKHHRTRELLRRAASPGVCMGAGEGGVGAGAGRWVGGWVGWGGGGQQPTSGQKHPTAQQTLRWRSHGCSGYLGPTARKAARRRALSACGLPGAAGGGRRRSQALSTWASPLPATSDVAKAHAAGHSAERALQLGSDGGSRRAPGDAPLRGT
jgi:hypothetical protein